MEIPGGRETSSVFLKCCQSQECYSGYGSCFDNILLQWLLSDVYLHVNTNHTANEDNDKSVQVQSSKVCSTIRKFCGLLKKLTGKCFSVVQPISERVTSSISEQTKYINVEISASQRLIFQLYNLRIPQLFSAKYL